MLRAPSIVSSPAELAQCCEYLTGSTFWPGHFERLLRYMPTFCERVVAFDRDSCWLWMGAVNAYGYGYINLTYAERKATGHHTLMVPSFALEAMRGPLPPGIIPDHLCKMRRCANPRHLDPVTQAMNVLRGNSPSGLNARKTHCKHGHPLTEANVYLGEEGHRRCRECGRLRALAKRRMV